MMSAGGPAKRRIEPLPENLFREPIDCLHADHFRLRLICDSLERVFSTPTATEAPAAAQIVWDFLGADFARHVADEEEDVFPLLRDRSTSDSAAGVMLARVIEEHRNNDRLLHQLRPGLNRIIAGLPPDSAAGLDRVATEFVGSLRQHLAWEESHVFPMARRCLSAGDLVTIGRRMAARREIAFPEG